jgi:hypothetical protein
MMMGLVVIVWFVDGFLIKKQTFAPNSATAKEVAKTISELLTSVLSPANL